MQHGHYFWLTTLYENLCRTSYKEREISTFSHSLGHGGCNKLTSFTCIKKIFEYKKQRLFFCCLFSLIVKNLWFQGNCSQAGESTKNLYQCSFIVTFCVTFCDFPCGLACCSWGGTGHLLIGKLAVLSQSAPGSPCLIILGQDTEPCTAFRCIHQSMNVWMTEKSACEACYIKCFKLLK